MTRSNRTSTTVTPQRQGSAAAPAPATAPAPNSDLYSHAKHTARERAQSRDRPQTRDATRTLNRRESLDRSGSRTGAGAGAGVGGSRHNPYSSFGINVGPPTPISISIAQARSPGTLQSTAPNSHSGSNPTSSSTVVPPSPGPTSRSHGNSTGVGTEMIPGSPSQIDPFGSQVTSPETIHSHSHPHSHSQSHSRSSSRPPSTVLSSGTPLSLNGSIIVTPKIILASPSTSTIHYLFPSSDTCSGTSGFLGSATPTITTAVTEVEAKPVQRTKSTSSTRGKANRTSFPRARAIEESTDKSAKLDHSAKYQPPSAQKHKKSTSVSQAQHTSLASNRHPPVSNVTGSVRKSDISGPILVPPPNGYASTDDEMGSLRRQPGMIDLSKRGKDSAALHACANVDRSVKKRESAILREIENRRERRGWEIGSRVSHPSLPSQVRIHTDVLQPYHTVDPIEPPCPKSRTHATHQGAVIRGPLPYPYVPSSATIAQRRRSQSLSSPRPAPAPPVPSPMQDGPSPLLPAPDFGDPLTLSVVIDSPSYSHLDYSIAGSSESAGASKRGSRITTPVFPGSVPMSRGTTRRGLGSYDTGKIKAQEDAERRLNGGTEKIGRFASIRRTVSLRRKGEQEDSKKSRPRSQSLTARSARNMGLGAPPVLTSTDTYTDKPRKERHSFFGDLTIDLGDRYASAFSPTKATPSDWASPSSADTSVFSHSTPSTQYDSLPSALSRDENGVHVVGRPLHPALNASEISILAPSTVGSGFSPIGTPVSLPESLEAEVVDLTHRGQKPSSKMLPQVSDLSHASSSVRPAPSPSAISPVEAKSSSEKKLPRRSLLLAQNTFYLPPLNQKAALAKRSSLRSSKSLGPGLMKRAYTSANIQSNSSAAPGNNGSATGTTRGLQKSASIRSGRPAPTSNATRHMPESSSRLSATPSMRFRRPMTTFSLCSPPDAIEPLPYTSPNSAVSHGMDYAAQSDSRALRSNKSSPFLSASASLRVIFGREGFVARSLSQAFETREMKEKQNGREGATERSASYNGASSAASGLKAKISSPLEAGRSSFRTHNADARASVRNDNRAWRASILRNAVSLSFKEGLNKLADETSPEAFYKDANVPSQDRRMVSSGSKSRLAIPDQLLSAPIIRDTVLEEQPAESRESKVFAGIGEAMLRPGDSIASGLSLRAVMEDLEVPLRALNQVGKEESMASASIYSNNASTFFEKKAPTTRLLGKGLPSSLSTSTTVTEGLRAKWSPTAESTMPMPSTSARPVTGRVISGPMPLLESANINVGSTRPLSLRSSRTAVAAGGKKEGLRPPSPITAAIKVSSSRSKLLISRVLSGGSKSNGDTTSSATAIEGGKPSLHRTPSSFSLSLRTSIRSYSRPSVPKSPQPQAQSHSQSISNSRNQPVSSTDLPPARAILDQLVAREEAAAAAAAAAAAESVAGASSSRHTSEVSGEQDKVRQVLAWRSEVDENERLAKLEEKMRGFVQDEKERIREIGRFSIEGN